jgi:hypothetical protein
VGEDNAVHLARNPNRFDASPMLRVQAPHRVPGGHPPVDGVGFGPTWRRRSNPVFLTDHLLDNAVF